MKPMTLDQALESVLGRDAARSMTRDMGRHWTIVAALAAAKTSDDPRAIAALDKHIGRAPREPR